MASDSYEKIDDPIYMRCLLKKVMAKHALASITDEGNNPVCNSILLDLDSKNKLLHLDPPNSLLNKDALGNNKKININVANEGIEVKFTANIKKVGRNYSSLVLDLPQEIEYRQRRQNFRVPLSQSTQVPLTIYNQNHEISGKVTDISVGGVAIIFGIDISEKITFKESQKFPCKLDLPGHPPIECDLIIRFYRFNEETGKQKIGAQFDHLNREQLHYLSQFINEVQRQQIKRK